MPIIKQAQKKLRHDRRRTEQNLTAHQNLKKILRSMRKSPSAKLLKSAYQILDKAAKRNLIHRNKASRLKSRLSLLLNKK